MASLSLSALVERLSPHAKETLEQAAALASSRTHHSIELSHWLTAIIQHPEDLYLDVFDKLDLDKQTVLNELLTQLEKYKTGCETVPGLSAHTVTVMQNAFMAATIEFKQDKLTCIHVLYAYLSDDTQP